MPYRRYLSQAVLALLCFTLGLLTSHLPAFDGSQAASSLLGPLGKPSIEGWEVRAYPVGRPYYTGQAQRMELVLCPRFSDGLSPNFTLPGATLEPQPGQAWATAEVPFPTAGRLVDSLPMAISLPALKGVPALQMTDTLAVRWRPAAARLNQPATPRLYQGCRHSLQLAIEGASPKATIELKTQGATLHKGPDEDNCIELTPTDAEVSLTAYALEDGRRTPLQTYTYTAFEPPLPSLKLYVNGQEWQPGEAVPKAAQLELHIRADEAFAQTYPDEARYQLNYYSIAFWRGPVLAQQRSTWRGRHIIVPISIPNDIEVRDVEKLYISLGHIERLASNGSMHRLPLDGGQRQFRFYLRD